MTKISKNIKRLRNSQNISQEVLAERLFISRQAVSSWENDRTQPDIEMIGKLAEVFNVSVEELIYEKTNFEPAVGSLYGSAAVQQYGLCH